MRQLFGLLSGLLPLIGVGPYVRDILRSKTKPHRGSFLIWAVLGLIALFSQLADGATWSLLLPAADTLATVIIFMLSLKYGVGGLSKQDMGALAGASFGLLLWYYTKQPLAALLLVIGVDGIGTVLTLMKTYTEPHTETLSSWLLASLGGLFAALTISAWLFNLLLYPIYIFFANGAIVVVILLRRGKVMRAVPADAEVSPYVKEP